MILCLLSHVCDFNFSFKIKRENALSRKKMEQIHGDRLYGERGKVHKI